jgi:hypothetical protein
MEVLGIVYDDEDPVYKYIGLYWKRNEKRLSLDEILELELKRYYLLEHGGFFEICTELHTRHGVLTSRMEKSTERFALSNMELIWRSIDTDEDDIIIYDYGKWRIK